MNGFFRKKQISNLSGADSVHSSADGLKKVLTVKDLTLMGVAAVIGGGIFSTIGSAAYAGGPGVVLLFIITAITCGFTALCYAEFASRFPIAGSAYTYSYISFGEVIAWIIGWALILEYAIGNIVVAISWSAYFNNILHSMGIHLPEWLTIGYHSALIDYQEALSRGDDIAQLAFTQAPKLFGIPFVINLPAFIIVVLVSILAYIGIQESKRTANVMVIIKIIVLVIVALIGLWFIFSEGTTKNWTPFLPNGMSGVLKGVSAVFFAYIGFDAISTTAEECKDPKRDLPKGMMYSLLICTVIYIVTALVITGLVHYSEFKNVTDPLAYVFDRIQMQKVGLFISLSAVIAATSVLLVFQLGQPRIWMSMSRDGLLPGVFGKVNRRFKTPGFSTIVAGLLVATLVLFIDDLLVTDLTSIGTLFAFVLVSGGVLFLPRIERSSQQFTIPFINARYAMPVVFGIELYAFAPRIESVLTHMTSDSYQDILFLIFIFLSIIITIYSIIRQYSLIPVLGVMCCLYLMIEIPAASWLVFFGWMGLGLSIYLAYGRKHSKLNSIHEISGRG